MEIYVQLILILALLNYCLNAALAGRPAVIGGCALFASIFAFVLYPVMITQPTSIISDFLSSRKLVTNWAVIATVEAVAGLFASVTLIQHHFKPKKDKKRSLVVLKAMPGVLFYIAIAYFELVFFKHNPGVAFNVLALFYAGIVLISTLSISAFVAWLLPAETSKFELKALISIAMLAICLFINSSVAEYNTARPVFNLDWSATLSFLALMGCMFIAGYVLSGIKITSFLKHRLWNK